MARIAGVDIPREKKVKISLTSIYGIGQSSALAILSKAKVDPERRVHKLTEKDVVAIRDVISEDYKVEGSVRTEVTMNIKRLMDIGCYRGLRHRKGLPVRGQSTHNNARTRKGRRPPVAGKRKTTGKKG